MRNFIATIFQALLTLIFSTFLVGFIIICFGLGVAGGFVIGCWEDVEALDLKKLQYHEDKHTWHQNLEVYSTICEVQRRDTAEFLVNKLKRIEYEEITQTGKVVNSQGEFLTKLNGEKGKQNGTIYVFTRQFNYPQKEHETSAKRLTINISNGIIQSINDKDGNSLLNFYLEPELIAEPTGDTHGTTRKIIPIVEMPEKLKNAFIAIEDRRFYQHSGIDVIRLVGAIKDTLLSDDRLGATSTLTQQLTRNIYMGPLPERTIVRKLREILLAFRIERQLSKSQILEGYLNYIDFGRFGNQQLYGVQKASTAFFDKDVSELDFHECALLAGLPKAPSDLSPVNPKTRPRSLKRRNVVLRAMYNQGFINNKEYESSRNQPIQVQNPTQSSVKEKQFEAGHFIAHIKSELEKIPQLKNILYNEGLKVYTTIDMSMQSLAVDVVSSHLRSMDSKYGVGLPNYEANKNNPKGIHPQRNYLQAALIAFEPSTGHVKAMVGGRDYRIDGKNPYIAEMKNYNFLNRAVGNSLRQPGSAFKPIVLAALMEDPPLISPATIIVDEPWTIEHVPGQLWAPRNYTKGRFHGPVTVRKILAKSINVPTARAAWETPDTQDGYKEGIVRVVNLAKRMGISTHMNPAAPSLTLGSYGMTVLELTAAYGIFANRGIKVTPNYIEYVTDENGVPIYPPENQQPDRTRVIDEKVAYQITSLLQGVINEGTGISAKKYFNPHRAIAGKTGTTNDYVDAWFVGYTTDLVVGVWVGLDKQHRKIRNYNQQGAWAAMPIWAGFLSQATRGPEKEFPIPKGIQFWEIDKVTGLLRNKDKCPDENISNEPFIEGQEPTKICDQH